MQLLSQKEAVISSDKRKNELFIEIVHLEKLRNSLNHSIDVENQNFSKRMEEQRVAYQEEKQKLQNELKQLQNSIDVLRVKNEKSYLAVESIKKDAEKMLFELQKKLKNVSEKEDELDLSLQNIHTRLDEIADKEAILQEEEQKFLLRKKAVEEESKMVSDGHAKLNTMLLDFQNTVQQKSLELRQKEEALIIRENLLKRTHIKK